MELNRHAPQHLTRRRLLAFAGGAVFTSLSSEPALGRNLQLDLADVLLDVRDALEVARTYRYQLFRVDDQGTRVFLESGDVDLTIGRRAQRSDQSEPYYFVDSYMYQKGADGTWYVNQPPVNTDEALQTLFRSSDDLWSLDTIDTGLGQSAYPIVRTGVDHGMDYEVRIWVDTETFLPVQSAYTYLSSSGPSQVTLYGDFGEAVDVQLPPEAAAIRAATVTAETNAANATATADAQVAANRQRVIDLLLQEPFPDNALPTGFAGADVFATVPDQTATPGAVSEIRVNINQSGPFQRITYVIFDSDFSADAARNSILNEVLSKPPYSSGNSAVSNTVISDQTSGYGASVVSLSNGGNATGTALVVIGFVLIIGVATINGTSRADAEMAAALLSFSGLHHLLDLLEN